MLINRYYNILLIDFMFQAKILNVGGDSMGIVIPKAIAKALKLELGKEIIVEIKKVK
jgi:hypothetical protein